MKIDDIAKQLANKVNQEHYIKHYLEKVQRGAYNKGVKDAEAKQLNLCGVRNKKEVARIVGVKDYNTLNNYIKRFKDKKVISKDNNNYILNSFLNPNTDLVTVNIKK